MARKILVVAQTPPPLHGQAMTNAILLEGTYPDMSLIHVPVNFSRSTSEIGKVTLRKALHLISVLVQVVGARVRTGARTLLYPLAANQPRGVVKDALLFGTARHFFDHTILHIHSGSYRDELEALPSLLRPLARHLLSHADLGIECTADDHTVSRYLRTQTTTTVYNTARPVCSGDAANSPGLAIQFLYLGAVRHSKGTTDFVRALSRVREKGFEEFNAVIAGPFVSSAYAVELQNRITEAGLSDHVSLPGPVTGHQKSEIFESSDIFVFPSFYRSERFPVVLLEAMSCSLPVIATKWRGIPEIVAHGETGMLVSPKSPSELASCMLQLATQPEVREKYGAAGFNRYQERFSKSAFVDAIGRAFEIVA